LDIFNCLYKDAAFADNPPSLRPLPSEDNPDGFFQSFRYTVNHPDTIAFARTLRRVVDEFGDGSDGGSRFLVGEVFGPPALLRRYCQRDDHDDADRGLHLVFLFRSLHTPFTAAAFRALIAEYEREFAAPLLPTYVFGNHDRPRCAERLGHDPLREKLLATLQLTVRGVPFLYYGDELGLPNLDLPVQRALDPLAAGYRWLPNRLIWALRRRGILLNRDECRAPLPWSTAAHGGFTSATATPWLPLPPQLARYNIASQQRDPTSLWHCYRQLLALRAAQPALHRGSLALLGPTALPGEVLGYQRRDGDTTLEVWLNFSPQPQTLTRPSCGRLLFCTDPNQHSGSGPLLHLRPFAGVVCAVN
jgi:oligo-1,6-glucosidase/alpha-glucosidase